MISPLNDLSPGEKPDTISSGPVKGGRGVVTTKLANLDRSGHRAVKPGNVISCGGLHYRVTHVRLGRWDGYQAGMFKIVPPRFSSDLCANSYIVDYGVFAK